MQEGFDAYSSVRRTILLSTIWGAFRVLRLTP
jgi:hypothetical protein